MCPSIGDKNSSVCGGYFHYVWTQSLDSPCVIRDWLSLQWEQRICVWGHNKHSIWALDSKSLCLGHTLSPLRSAIPPFSPLRAMETRSISLSALSYSLSSSVPPHYFFSPVFITVILTAIRLIGTGRVGHLLNCASRWLSVCCWVHMDASLQIK